MTILERYFKNILLAKVYDVAKETPLDYAPCLSKKLGQHIWLKREDLQPVFSFKLRGAYNKIRQLSEKELSRGVIAASAGNHAQGVALSASHLGTSATIVMPKTTPKIKVQAVQALGGKTVLFGDTYDEACEHAQALAKKDKLVFVHPYDDPDVIAGQGTVAMELLQQNNENFDAVFIPVGGGGLIAGMAAYIKSLRPEIKVIGVEPEDAACLAAALKAGRRVSLPFVGLFADGVAVKKVGEHPFKVAKLAVDEVITVSTDEICAGIKDIFEEVRVLTEPAGALALAGLKKYVQQYDVKDQRFACVVSGANVNFDRLRHIAERADVGEHNETLLAVSIPEKAGSFKAFCKALGKRSITEFNYRYADDVQAEIFVGIETKDDENDRFEVIDKLVGKGYEIVDLTDNEMAKLHIRHMVGGRSQVENEVLFRFRFPERPGALLDFLDCVGQRWNISLFHYRNHGAAYGRILVGLQIPHGELQVARQHLDDLGYSYLEESDNPAFSLFLK